MNDEPRGMMAKITSFRDLDIWRLGKEIALKIYEVTRDFPKEELYGLVMQMRRAALSIPSNIAEGFARLHNREYRQFLYIALGSCAELATQIEISFDLGYLGGTTKDSLLEKLDHESRMIKSLIKKL